MRNLRGRDGSSRKALQGIQGHRSAVLIYGLNGQTCSDAKDYIASTGAGYPQIVATEALLRYVSYMPSTHIFDSSGRMIAKYAGTLSEAEWINVIETLMAKYS